MVEEVEVSRRDQPDVLLDKIVFGVTLEMQSPLPLLEITRRLRDAGIAAFSGPASPTKAIMEFSCTVSDLPGGGAAAVSGRLQFDAGEGRVRLLSGSHLAVNGMRLLRTQLEAPAATEGGLAGDNFIGAWDDGWPAYLDAQVAGLASALGAIVDGLAEAAECPTPPAGRFRLRWAEACRDFAVADAPALARRLASLWLGGQLRRHRNYPGGLEIDGVLPAVSWAAAGRYAPVHKVYAKARALLRTEVTARRAEAVGHLLAGRRRADDADAPLAAEAVADLLRRFATVAAPLLDEAREVVEEVEESDPAPIQLLLRLTPLLAIAAPSQRRGAGRPVSEAVRAAAVEAVESLLQIGRVSTRGLRSGTALRRVLEEMAEGDDAVLQRHGAQGSLFAIRPHLAEALRHLAAPAERDTH